MAPSKGALTRERIGRAAAELFEQRGYARVTVREIAQKADADPALVIRHFGSKQLLFLEVMHPSFEDDPVTSLPLDQLGRRFIELLLDDTRRAERRAGATRAVAQLSWNRAGTETVAIYKTLL